MIFDRLKNWLGFGSSDDGGGEDLEMLSCEEALDRLYEYLDGELDEEMARKVEAHFVVCQRCYPRLAMEKRFREAVHRAVDRDGAPPELRDRILDLIESEEE